MPLTSIIIVAPKEETYLEAALRSALKQTASDLEVILVAEMHSETAVDLVGRLADERLRLAVQKHPGLNAAVNAGIQNSRGRFIGFLDGKDIWHPKKLAAHLEHLETKPGLGISLSNVGFIPNRGKFGQRFLRLKTGIVDPEILLGQELGASLSRAVVRRAALDEIVNFSTDHPNQGIFFDESSAYIDDIGCWLHIALKTPFRVEAIDKILTRRYTKFSGDSENCAIQIIQKYESWELLVDRVFQFAPNFIEEFTEIARARRLLGLAMLAVDRGDQGLASAMVQQALDSHRSVWWNLPFHSAKTIISTFALRWLGQKTFFQLRWFVRVAATYAILPFRAVDS